MRRDNEGTEIGSTWSEPKIIIPLRNFFHIKKNTNAYQYKFIHINTYMLRCYVMNGNFNGAHINRAKSPLLDLARGGHSHQ